MEHVITSKLQMIKVKLQEHVSQDKLSILVDVTLECLLPVEGLDYRGKKSVKKVYHYSNPCLTGASVHSITEGVTEIPYWR